MIGWCDEDVFEEVEGPKCISTLKETIDGLMPKSRLVAREFEGLEVSVVKSLLHVLLTLFSCLWQ